MYFDYPFQIGQLSLQIEIRMELKFSFIIIKIIKHAIKSVKFQNKVNFLCKKQLIFVGEYQIETATFIIDSKA